MGCLRRLLTGIGCLVVLLAALAGWLYRDRLGVLYRRIRGVPEPAAPAFVTPRPDAAREAQGALDRFAQAARHGTAGGWVDISADQLAGLIDRQLEAGPVRSLDSVAVALDTARVRVRGSLDVTVLPRRVLGPLAGAMSGRQPVVAGGPLVVTPDGRLWWRIDELKLGDLSLPRATIPVILKAMSVTDGQGASVPVPLPTPVGDVRVTPAGIRLYRPETPAR